MEVAKTPHTAPAGPYTTLAFEDICRNGRSSENEATLIVRFWRFFVRPLLSLLLRLAMKDTVSTGQSMVRACVLKGFVMPVVV